MNNQHLKRCCKLILLLACLLIPLTTVAGEDAVVRGVLFYSPTCPHCHKVIENVLPPLVKRYGKRLMIAKVNVRERDGSKLYQAAVEHFGIEEDRRGVPTLVVGTQVMVGDGEIPQRLPDLIETSLAQGGVDWPAIPGLFQALIDTGSPPAGATEAEAGTSAQAMIELAAPASLAESLQQKLARDPVGNGLAVLVLLLMVVVLIVVLLGLSRRIREGGVASRLGWSVPALALAGLGVAAYLAWIETAKVAAVCGPVGDCNTVQQSEYAHLFGIPMGVLGVVAYLGIFFLWLVEHRGPIRWRPLASLLLFALTLGGILFSIYLTFLEPFVIGATCIWCLTSAIIMTSLLWLTQDAAAGAWRTVAGRDKQSV